MCKNPSNKGTPLTVLDVKIQRQIDPSTLTRTDFFGLIASEAIHPVPD